VLYYDRQTETFWSGLTGGAVVGPLTGSQLKWVDSEVASWKQWRKSHPKTTVLKPPRPIGAYRGDPYSRYREVDRIIFPTGPHPIDKRYPPKSSCTIVLRKGKARCYPHAALKEGRNRDGELTIVKQGENVRVLDAEGKAVASMFAYWFAWCAFYPKGTVYSPPSKASR